MISMLFKSRISFQRFFSPILFCAGAALHSPVFADYSTHDNATNFVKKMVDTHQFEEEYVRKILSEAKKKQSILDAISRPAEKTKAWWEYRKIFLGEKRINQGVEFWSTHQNEIARAAAEYGVAPEIIVAIIGVETRYGRHAGSYRVIDALSTLSFDYPRRSKFFTKELEHFLLLTREQKQDPLTLKGSYAGAMGFGQFMPSSYRSYAVDFDKDGTADIWNNPSDAIGSVANYFKRHGWKDNEPVLTRARIAENYDKSILNKKSKPKMALTDANKKGFVAVDGEFKPESKVVPLSFTGKKGKEFWLGFNNFYVITRYNRSHLYAMAVWQLSQEIREEYEKESQTG